MSQRGWYRFSVQDATPEVAELLIYDIIGYDFWTGEGVTAKQFVKDLAALPAAVAAIKVRVNSPGGDVFDAVAIANALKQHPARIEMSIEGLAASAATIITCAGDDIRIADNALMMIHNPWSWCVGSAKDMRKVADDLDTIRGAIVATYRWVTSIEDAEILALMDAETWFDADAAIAAGFATEKVEGLKAAALLDRRAIAKLPIPEKHRAAVEAFVRPEPTPPAPPAQLDAKTVLAVCGAAGFPELAEDLLDVGALDAVHTRLEGAKQIRAACDGARLPEFAAGYIKAQVPLPVVKAHLTLASAKIDAAAQTDPALLPETKAGAKPVINTTEIYRQRNAPATAAKGA